MSDMLLAALIAGGISILNGPVLLTIMNRNFKKKDDGNEAKTEIANLKEEFIKLFNVVNRIGKGLNIGLCNDRVIFEAFRKNSINGESEKQDQIMDEYFTECVKEGLTYGGEK